MARRGSRAHAIRNRDAYVVPSRRLVPVSSRFVVFPSPFRRPFLAPQIAREPFFGDRRYYHPLGAFAPPAASPVAARRLVDRSPWRSPSRLSFAVPHNVALCVRRGERREVLFAKKLTGRGARARKRRNLWSVVKCR